MTAGSIAVPHIIPIRAPLPGRAKHHVDTTTPLEIKSDTPDVTIYYTLDGSKPEAERRSGPGESSTLEYKGPIYLPKGKVYVKAVATTRDGRESSVVSKLFLVHYVPSNEPVSTEDGKEKGLKDYAHNLSKQQETLEGSVAFLNTANGVESLGENTLKEHHAMKVKAGDSSKSSKSPDFHKTLGSQSSRSQTQNLQAEILPGKTLTNTQMSRIQRETDFLRCAQCLSLRPSDPFARFCLQCGAPVPPIPGQRLPPTEGAQTGLCACCKATVPVNTPICVVCEAPMAPQLQPQASLRLQDKVICQSCGTGNPAHIDLCVTCETKLPELPATVPSGQRAPAPSKAHGKMVSCHKCSRVNSSDARFCDWCGAKVIPSGSHLTCPRCGASGHPYANFCGCCGVFLEGPLRLDLQPGTAREEHQMGISQSDSTMGRPMPSAPVRTRAATPAPTLVDRHTQTVGLFFPSGTMLQKKHEQIIQEMAKQGQMRDRRPLLSAISPGRGYWRKQLDHICAHLRSYALNNPDFRALIGEPRMGKIISSVVQEDNGEVSLRINFVSAAAEEQGGFKEKFLDLLENHTLSSVTGDRKGLSGSQSSLGEQKRNKNNIKKISIFQNEEKVLESKDKQLLMEVGPEGKGQISVVQQLLDEGADPSCQDSKGLPALTVAVVNQHHEVIPLLVQKGADIDEQSGPMNNTALHEAAACGNHGLQCAEILLGCNASTRRKNNLGLTAYDLAVKCGCSRLVSLITEKNGQDMLDLSNSRTNRSLDVF
ncbi:double zinc ribbon and ankyrin repeat-containing protein 1 [Scleropages formosus]|uniref:double zinc ribbon and ankyrin repeat-containing protein 1 n=1 Tax=Scleropages formosus TaxID=113540 RepID=UPI0010FAA010|nr:double zinc ribbon and ankyrin repeat-containing protein 1 [Scleropages formosus]